MASKKDTFNYLESEEPGEICLELLKRLKGIQRGDLEDGFGWRVEVKGGEVVKGLEEGAKAEDTGAGVGQVP